VPLADWLAALRARFPEEHGVMDSIFESHAATPDRQPAEQPEPAAEFTPIAAPPISEAVLLRYLAALAPGSDAGPGTEGSGKEQQ
jgi:hypothetical protein